jgi:hypothetical protein
LTWIYPFFSILTIANGVSFFCTDHRFSSIDFQINFYDLHAEKFAIRLARGFDSNGRVKTETKFHLNLVALIRQIILKNAALNDILG